MKACWYERLGDAREVLQYGEQPTPEPQAGEVLIEVYSSGVNPSDIKARTPWLGRTAPYFPRVVPHQDGAGVIRAVGEGVSPERIGERVWFFEAQFNRASGSAAEFVSLPQENAIHLPEDILFEEGACLGVPAMTAHRCVFGDGEVRGKTVLVTGAAGAVGRFAVQFARQGGARVIATVSNARQAHLAREAGAHFTIDRHEEDIPRRIAEITGTPDGRAIDRIVEVAFGENLATTLAVLRHGGIVATYSSDAQPEPALPFWSLLGLDATLHFVLVYTMPWQAHLDAIAAITEGLEKGWLSCQIGHIYPLTECWKAHEAVEAGGTYGKILVCPNA